MDQPTVAFAITGRNQRVLWFLIIFQTNFTVHIILIVAFIYLSHQLPMFQHVKHVLALVEVVN